jgi:SAM-dependent methyltransferase
MRWQAKCVLDSVKGLIPFKDQIRTMKRSISGYPTSHPDDIRTIEQGIEQIHAIGAAIDLSSATVLEVGSGWKPMIPMLFSLAGTKQTILTDVTRLLHVSSLKATVVTLRANSGVILEGLGVSNEEFESFLKKCDGDDLEESLKLLRLRYMAPCDDRSTGLPSESIDAMISRAVMEHIPPEIIRGILKESARILKPGGINCHVVDNSDHWEHYDKSISRVNFLKFSDSAFRWTCINGLSYQNRLRHSQYGQMLKDTGFSIEREEKVVDPQALKLLENFPVDKQFSRFSKEDLATITSFFFARRLAPSAN